MTDQDLEVLRYSYEVGGFTTRSDYSRANADAVASCACQGLITTEVPREGFGNIWRVTSRGIEKLFKLPPMPSAYMKHGGVPDQFLNYLTGTVQ